MAKLAIQSAVDQVAAHLRNRLADRIWGDTIPGGHPLAAELGVNHKTVEGALRQLEMQGLLTSQGMGRCRRVVARSLSKETRPLRIAIFTPMASDHGVDFMIELRHILQESGHLPFSPEKSLLELGMDTHRVARFVERTEADAWVVTAASRQVLQWFSEQPRPALALFGNRTGLPIAGSGPNKSPAFAGAARQLIDLGHRRITLLIRNQHRRPKPASVVRVFQAELEAHDIQVGEFNLPDWEESRAGYQEILESLFRLTPPTALIIDEAFLFIAAQQFITRRGLRVPEDVSLICTDSDPTFAWCQPSIAHIAWDYQPVVHRIVHWAANVSKGRKDVRQTSSLAEFIPGGTMGPPPIG